MKNKLWLILFILIIFSLGYFRDRLFVNVNYQLGTLYHNTPSIYLSEYFLFLKNYTYQQLYWSKWILTIFFTLLYYSLTILVTLITTGKKSIIKWCTITYVFFFVLSGLCFLIGKIIGNPEAGYKFARIFMGILQSPIILMILYPLFSLSFKSKSDS